MLSGRCTCSCLYKTLVLSAPGARRPSEACERWPRSLHTKAQHVSWHAVCSACRQIQARLEPVRAQLADTATFKEVVNAAYFQRVDLSAHGFYITPNVDGERIWGCCWDTPSLLHACEPGGLKMGMTWSPAEAA